MNDTQHLVIAFDDRRVQALAANPQQELEAKTFASAMWRRRGQQWQLLQFQATGLEAA